MERKGLEGSGREGFFLRAINKGTKATNDDTLCCTELGTMADWPIRLAYIGLAAMAGWSVHLACGDRLCNPRRVAGTLRCTAETASTGSMQRNPPSDQIASL